LSSRSELAGRASWLIRWAPVAAAGGAAGAVLLESTPSGVFIRVVPYLVLIGSVAIAAQPTLANHLGGRLGGRSELTLPVGLGAVGLYNGYFGAGSGIMFLAVTLLTVEIQWARANALKNMLVGAASIVAAMTLALFARVEWLAVAPLAAGMFAGSLVGPRIARRLSGNGLRWIVALMGIGFAIELFVNPTA
ncbi:MAG: sulfite exporter TauE/SafE family protein, partial [Acidimicrobiales bacterium]